MLKISTSREVKSELNNKAQTAVESLKSITASGFVQIASNEEMWNPSAQHGQLLSKNFSVLGVLGIGGSSLGPKVIQQFLSSTNQKPIHFFENVDPISFDLKLKLVGSLKSAHWLVISKSGKTLETLAQLSLLVKKYTSQELSKHFTVVSDSGSNPLTEWAKKNSVTIFHIPKNVGGRYSVLTPVGLIPAAFLGIDINELRAGAVSALNHQGLAAQAVAQTLTSFEKNEWLSVFWNYSDQLGHLGGWVQQLWAESLAKKLDREAGLAPRVSTPLPLLGANDQHSILQQVMDGARDKFIWFMGVESIEDSGEPISDVIGLPEFINGKTLGQILKAERVATRQALKDEGVQSMEIMIQDLSPKSLGFLFMFFQLVVAGVAEALDIDAFDQPGVELGKRLAMNILSR